VNFSEPGISDLCAHFLAHGVGIEAGLWSVQDAQVFLIAGLAGHCLRILIELQEPEIGSVLATTEAIIHCLDEGHIHLPRLLHGYHEAIVWPMLAVALPGGYDTRIGMGDTLTLPDGKQAKDNAELVSLAMSKARHIGTI
jgi:uncharacterized protein (DUF849 family)